MDFTIVLGSGEIRRSGSLIVGDGLPERNSAVGELSPLVFNRLRGGIRAVGSVPREPLPLHRLSAGESFRGHGKAGSNHPTIGRNADRPQWRILNRRHYRVGRV